MSEHLLASPPAAIIFDLDGTLIDTEPLYSAASQRILDPFGNLYTPELKKRAMGGDSHRSAQMVIDEYELPLSADEYLERRERHLTQMFVDVAEIDGAGSFVTAVKENNVPLGLATSSHANQCSLKLSNKPWANLFNVTIHGDHAELKHSKPEPDIFLICARYLGVAPDLCVAFEDSPNGVEAARRAGMKICALSNPYADEHDLADADLVFAGYAELMSVVAGW